KVIEIQGQRAFITLGNARAWVPLYEIKKSEKQTALSRENLEPPKSLPSEINLIGLSTEEALVKLERYIQEASSLGLKSFKLIHGHSNLKKASQELLSRSELVLFHREGYPHEGGPGVSIVYLKRD
ncbi:MAG: Smr/MutS family protein, partial [Aquificaceae bacterium]|nr:Smr/MutS family protein [Aquificaceae bacterium]